jgi:hypothetical protein
MKFDKFKRDVFSQNGEDGILLAILDLIPKQDLRKLVVEFGAWDGINFSNTYNLILNHGYKGILIESDKKRFEELVQNTRNLNTININQRVDLKGSNSNSTLDEILLQHNAPKDFDLLSIDIDGADYHIWDELVYFRPKIVVIEYNPAIPRSVEFINPYNTNVNKGSSARSLILLANMHEYILAAQTHCNLILVSKEFSDFLGIDQSDNDFNLLTESNIPETYIFSTFDGVLHISNPLNLHWHDIKVPNNYEFRFLPKYFQQFPDKKNRIFQKLLKFYACFTAKG